MVKLTKLLTELIDIYPPEELTSRGITYNIDRESKNRFRATLKYKDHHYVLTILPVLNPKRCSVNFGKTDENYENLDLRTLIQSPYSSRILAAIFGLIRYWVDKYNIQEFEYAAESPVRLKLYQYYLDKHFKDFRNSQEQIGNNSIQVWTKI